MSTIKVTNIQNESSATVNMSLGTSGQVTLAKSPVLNGSTSGTLTIAAPAVAGTNTITFPAATDTVATLAATQTLTNKTIQGGAITSATAQASTSGTSIDFTSIPSWVKRITVMFNGVSTNGSSFGLVQLGDSGGIENTGYTGSNAFSGASAAGANPTTGFGFGNNGAAFTFSGHMTITNVSGNIWVASCVGGSTNTNLAILGGGNKTLSNTLTQVRITTENGTDTFDAGTINIMYE